MKESNTKHRGGLISSQITQCSPCSCTESSKVMIWWFSLFFSFTRTLRRRWRKLSKCVRNCSHTFKICRIWICCRMWPPAVSLLYPQPRNCLISFFFKVIIRLFNLPIGSFLIYFLCISAYTSISTLFPKAIPSSNPPPCWYTDFVGYSSPCEKNLYLKVVGLTSHFLNRIHVLLCQRSDGFINTVLWFEKKIFMFRNSEMIIITSHVLIKNAIIES